MSRARSSSRVDWLVLATSLSLAALAGWIGLAGPVSPMPVHWGIDGRADRWADRQTVAWLVGALALACAVLGFALGVAARRSGAASRRRSLRWAQIVGTVALAGTAVLSASASLMRVPSLASAPGMAGMSLLLLVTGLLVGRAGANPFVGVRTPWTCLSRLSWERSNRLAGRLLAVIGAGGLAAAPFPVRGIALQALLGALGVSAVVVIVQSWLVWRSDPDRRRV